MSDRLVRTIDAAGRFLKPPESVWQAVIRWGAIVAAMFPVVILDNYSTPPHLPHPLVTGWGPLPCGEFFAVMTRE